MNVRQTETNSLSQILSSILSVKACAKVLQNLYKKQMPPMALANGLWPTVPKELSGLTFVEKLLISKVHVIDASSE